MEVNLIETKLSRLLGLKMQRRSRPPSYPARGQVQGEEAIEEGAQSASEMAAMNV
jgi:hypothetical protein